MSDFVLPVLSVLPVLHVLRMLNWWQSSALVQVPGCWSAAAIPVEEMQGLARSLGEAMETGLARRTALAATEQLLAAADDVLVVVVPVLVDLVPILVDVVPVLVDALPMLADMEPE